MPKFTDGTFQCPRCGRTSYNPNDAANGYCGACHWWTGDPLLGEFHPDDIEPREPQEKGWSVEIGPLRNGETQVVEGPTVTFT
jgi:hypothetical protein